MEDHPIIEKLKTLPYAELFSLLKELEAIAESKRQDAKEEMKKAMMELGFDANDFLADVVKQKRTRRTKEQMAAARAQQ